MRDEDFERLFAEHAGPLLGFLVYRTGDRALAEDLVATTFERALRARRRFDPRRAGEKTWLYAIALNCLTDEARRRSAETRALERAGVPAVSADVAWTEGVADRDVLGRAMDALAAEEREAVALRFGADLSVPEIARVLGVSLTTAEGRVYRGLRKLREQLDA
jgi:RNA polymerase sigma-70 factor (ECF subfamily)